MHPNMLLNAMRIAGCSYAIAAHAYERAAANANALLVASDYAEHWLEAISLNANPSGIATGYCS